MADADADAEAVVAEKTITKRVENLIEEYRNIDETAPLLDRLDLLKKMDALKGAAEEWAERLAFHNLAELLKPNGQGGGHVKTKTKTKRKKKRSSKKKRKIHQSFNG